MQHVKYREDIDALRGLAVLLVVIYHAFPNLLPGGFIGVDVFFVISGYLITSIMMLSIQRNEFSLRDFYARRIRRLFPALITVLLFVLSLGWLVLFPEEYEQLGNHVAKSVIFVLNFELINEVGYFDVESHYKPLLHLWTLSVEEQYYLLWPLIVLLFLKFNKHPFFLLAFIFISSLVANLYFSSGYTQETYYHTLTRFWQLAAGSLLAVALLNKKVNSNKLLLIGGALVIAFSAMFINSNMAYPGYWAILPVLGASLIIVANARLPYYFGLVKLGLISYPLYLWHWVLISFLYIYLGRQPENLVLFVAILVALLLSYLTYKYIERLRYKKQSVPYLILGLIIVGLMGFYVQHKKGIPERAGVQSFVDANEQFKRTTAKDDDCVNYSNRALGSAQIFNYCRSSEIEKNKLVAIIGDSHAHVLFPGIAKVAHDHGYGTLLLANSSCPTLQGFKWGRNPKEVESCEIKIEQISTILEKDQKIEKVIVATRGPVYINGEVDGVFTPETVKKSLSIVKDDKHTYKTYFDGFNKTLMQLENISHINEVFYMLENPELDFLPKEVIPRPYDFFEISRNRSFMDKKLYLQRMSIYRSYATHLNFSKLSILDPIDVLCDDKNCYSNKNGQFLYADDDHFSVYGSELIAWFFENQIFKR
ncbi:O-acetyltransferase OatA [Hydrogenovibrio crunogenus]|uniref:O-acetyltransferase OatA n=1 Tax=Hydrogenovibrio crunogenus TaxID=39765 RepID=A0A4P7P113_9GAMM|nr:acyltransferase family protein [Hydrogenovibrio crunogenus]QBZ83718.1 O-acetyltransferase OatA [Hydrogenovibrio crunogenus]